MVRLNSLTMLLPAAFGGLLLGPCKPVSAADMDNDGLDDGVEASLLAQYVPELRFDKGEEVWPCSASWFVQHSKLLKPGDRPMVVPPNPLQILTGGGKWKAEAQPPGLKLDIADNARHGEHPDNPGASENVAMYGHVVPLSDQAPRQYEGSKLRFGSGNILIQYWLLFPYNNAHKWDNAEHGPVHDLGDHEGDWVYVEVIVGSDKLDPRYAIFHHHGDRTIAPSVVEWQNVETAPTKAPVAYVERGVHELWPTKGGEGGATSPVESHQGNGIIYRPKVAINLGEKDKPVGIKLLPQRVDADLVLYFTGEWGDFTGQSPPGAPTITNPLGPVVQDFPGPVK